MLTELMDTLGERGAASADELARHLGMERGAVDPILERLLRKGRIRLLESCAGGCGGCRSCGEGPALYVLNKEIVLPHAHRRIPVMPSPCSQLPVGMETGEEEVHAEEAEAHHPEAHG